MLANERDWRTLLVRRRLIEVDFGGKLGHYFNQKLNWQNINIAFAQSVGWWSRRPRSEIKRLLWRRVKIVIKRAYE